MQKTKQLLLACLVGLLLGSVVIAAPFTVPKIYAPGDAITAADRNTELAAIASSLNNVTAAQITDSTITGAKIASNSIGFDQISADITGFVVVGSITQYAGSVQTDTLTRGGWLMCTGAVASKTTYPELWAIISTTYGPATASTFTLPDFRSRVAIGANSTVVPAGAGDTNDTRSIRTVGDTGGVQTLSINEMPAHNHTWKTQPGIEGVTTVLGTTATADATTVNSNATGGSKTDGNMQPYIVVNYIIYAGRP